jgi:ubiquinone/menaquinone biosynthesis C-methylase UbiE
VGLLKSRTLSGGSTSSVAKNFEKLWEKYERPSFIGEFLFKMAEAKVLKLMGKYVEKNAKVIDVGCGTGRTLMMFRKNGYFNSIGIDVSKKSIEACAKKGFIIDKDIFLMDITKSKFKDKEFDVVFAEGLLEHFENFQPVVDKLCKISKRYVLLIQPNHFSIFRKLEKVYYLLFPRVVVKELTYKVEDFSKSFKKNGFILKELKNSFLNFYWILLFERKVK